MSSLATVYICEEEAVEKLLNLFKSIKKMEPVRMKVLEFMRKSASSPTRIKHGILIISGVSDLLNFRYADANPLLLFKESLKNLSRDTVLFIQVKDLKWNPVKRSRVIIDGAPLNVSDLDLETTLKLQTEYLGTGKGRKKRQDNFVIARL